MKINTINFLIYQNKFPHKGFIEEVKATYLKTFSELHYILRAMDIILNS